MRCPDCHAEYLLAFSCKTRELCRHTGFSVHNRVRVEPEDGSAVERLARYIMRPPISLERIRWSGEGEVDPLLGPKCGGEMRIIAFITDHDVVDAILRHLAKAVARSPRGPPSVAALSAVS